MRGTSRLFAAVSTRAATHLTPYAPTGLTGLLTHPYPRPALLYLYSSTLNKLAQLPESSVYRQSTEALTRQRLAIVEPVEPPGFDAWQRRIEDHFVPLMAEQPIMAKELVRRLEIKGKPYLYQEYRRQEFDDRFQEWDGETPPTVERGEGTRTQKQWEADVAEFKARRQMQEWESGVEVENEPPLTADQISEIEQKIGAGLIEEVIQVAEGEHKLVDTMLQNKVWEELEEKPAEGQWTYFEREK